MKLPPETARLFPHHAVDEAASCPAFLIGRLLEDGDRRDLAELFAHLGEAPVAAWLSERGGRQLSRRSRAFWALVLATPPSRPAEGHDDLWLL